MLTRLAVPFALGFLLTPSAGAADDILVAAWETDPYEVRLTYQDGEMALHSRIEETISVDKLIERPAERTGKRRFDLNESVRSEYFTLSDIGIVRYFSWEGRHFATALTTFMDPRAMTIGANVQVRECVPKQLSAPEAEVIRLYKQLHAFKDDPEFADMGFSDSGPYHVWMQGAISLSSEADVTLLRQLGFMATDVRMLAFDYMRVASDVSWGESADPSKLENIEEVERNIQANLALAFCE